MYIAQQLCVGGELPHWLNQQPEYNEKLCAKVIYDLLQVRARVCARVRGCMRVRARACVRVRASMRACAREHACVCARACVRLCACVPSICYRNAFHIHNDASR